MGMKMPVYSRFFFCVWVLLQCSVPVGFWILVLRYKFRVENDVSENRSKVGALNFNFDGLLVAGAWHENLDVRRACLYTYT